MKLSKELKAKYLDELGGEVRYYDENGTWRYVHSQGEGSGLASLEAAQAVLKADDGKDAK